MLKLITHRSSLLLLLLLASATFARINVTVEPQAVPMGGTFVVSVQFRKGEVPGNRDFPRISNLADFQLIKKDSTESVQRDFFLGNFMVKKYRYHLKAKREGLQKIGPITWKVQGKNIQLGTAQVQIRRGYDRPGMVISSYVNKKEVFVGEQLRLSLKMSFYANYEGQMRYNLDPDFGSDFWVEHLEKPSIKLRKKQTVPGARTGDVVMAHLFPVRNGELKIEAFKFRYQKRGPPKKVVEKRPGFYFESTTQEPIPDSALTSPLTLRVKALPTEGKSAGFSGLVGQYSLKAKVDKNRLKVGEAVTLTLVISGNGRPKGIPDPELTGLSEFRLVPPETSLKKREKGGLIHSTKTLRYFLYPKRKGEFTVNSPALDYFDPKKKRYVHIPGKSFPIQVEKGDESTIPAGGTYNAAQQKRITRLGDDIRHIKKPALLQSRSDSLHHSLFFWALFLVPILIFLTAWWIALRQTRRSGNTGLQRRSKAAALARKRLKRARNLLHGDSADFHKEVQDSLVKLASDRSNREFQGLTHQAMGDLLLQCGGLQETVDSFLQLMERCNRALFAGNQGKAEPQKAQILLEEARELMVKLEKIS